MFTRNETNVVYVGGVAIGGGNPVTIQSMTNTKTEDAVATIRQIRQLEEAGCEIIRCTVPTQEAADAIRRIKHEIRIPLVADIHFDYKMAIAAMENGADAIRINPGNIGDDERVKAIVDCAKERNIPIRVGVNSGSLEKALVEKYGSVTPEALVESAEQQVARIHAHDYGNLVVSIKSSDVMLCVAAHELFASRNREPLHVGITEAGSLHAGNIKSAIGLGLILSKGIGDTIRVSLTGDPVEEIKSGRVILRTLGLRRNGIELVSCPTCGRTSLDLIGLAGKVEAMIPELERELITRGREEEASSLKLAVMGCVVNGPGEAREADYGICGGKGEGLLIRKGQILAKLPEAELPEALRQAVLNKA